MVAKKKKKKKKMQKHKPKDLRAMRQKQTNDYSSVESWKVRRSPSEVRKVCENRESAKLGNTGREETVDETGKRDEQIKVALKACRGNGRWVATPCGAQRHCCQV